MDNEQNMLIEDCCKYYSIETSFVRMLGEQGLLALEHRDESYFIHQDELLRLEKYMHLHYDLDINIPGIEAISHLLERIERLQTELRSLKEV
ncbi:MAG: chaperone modulator CbpM [Niabella sp.]